MLKLSIEKHPHIALAGEDQIPASYSVDFLDETEKVIYGFEAESSNHAMQTLGAIFMALKATEAKYAEMKDHIEIVDGAIRQLKLLED